VVGKPAIEGTILAGDSSANVLNMYNIQQIDELVSTTHDTYYWINPQYSNLIPTVQQPVYVDKIDPEYPKGTPVDPDVTPIYNDADSHTYILVDLPPGQADKIYGSYIFPYRSMQEAVDKVGGAGNPPKVMFCINTDGQHIIVNEDNPNWIYANPAGKADAPPVNIEALIIEDGADTPQFIGLTFTGHLNIQGTPGNVHFYNCRFNCPIDIASTGYISFENCYFATPVVGIGDDNTAKVTFLDCNFNDVILDIMGNDSLVRVVNCNYGPSIQRQAGTLQIVNSIIPSHPDLGNFALTSEATPGQILITGGSCVHTATSLPAPISLSGTASYALGLLQYDAPNSLILGTQILNGSQALESTDYQEFKMIEPAGPRQDQINAAIDAYLESFFSGGRNRGVIMNAVQSLRQSYYATTVVSDEVGTGYVVGDILTFPQQYDIETPLQITVTSVGTNGEITGLDIDDDGDYLNSFVGNSVVLIGGTGSGELFTITNDIRIVENKTYQVDDVADVIINDGGTGFNIGDSIQINGQLTNDIDILLVVSSVDGSGGVTEMTLSNKGSFYTMYSPLSITTSGNGTGLNLTINWTLADGSLLRDLDNLLPNDYVMVLQDEDRLFKAYYWQNADRNGDGIYN